MDDGGATAEQRARNLAGQQRALIIHAAVFAAVMLFLFVTDLSDGGNWWFFWPFFGWGIALAIHAAVVLSGGWAERRVAANLGRTTARPAPASASAASVTDAPARAVDVDAVEGRIQRLWRVARQIPDGAVRDQAFRICAAADRVAEVMATDRSDARTVAWFDERLLEPTESLLGRYVRLSSRNVAGADDTLRRVEEQNLPLIESRLDALYDQLHRGDVVDLGVASEMLEFDLPSAPPAIGRQTADGRRQTAEESELGRPR